MAEDQRMLPYVEPGQLVDIGGRRINLHCTGAGGPTVILMAGIFSWSVVWYKTQPVIAQKTRVCAFDRAGYGFSDPGPRPQILSDVVDDLHAALNAGPIPGPYVLLVVLSAEDSWGKSGTPESVWFHRSYSKVWIALQEALAHISSRGVHRIIKDSSHQIELDKPQAVIDAVDEVLRELHSGAKP